MNTMPTQIIDLHCHLFNARYLPLAGIIANAMNKDADQSRLAQVVAKLLFILCDSDESLDERFLAMADPTDQLIEKICDLTIARLREPTLANWGEFIEADKALATKKDKKLIESSEVHQCLSELESVLKDEFQYTGHQNELLLLSDFGDWARKIVRAALRKIDELSDKIKEIPNYIEFFFNILGSEHKIAEHLIKDYGKDLPPIQMVHHMMDMERAYVVGQTTAKMVAPIYTFEDVQLTRMQSLQSRYHGQFIGFTAFDPRRENCIDIMKKSKSMGFRGVKFYPAMGYMPVDDPISKVKENVDEFFKWCIKEDFPVFTHCTPLGMETRFRVGTNTNPIYWKKLLETDIDGTHPFEKLRLCFGHAGGEHAKHELPKKPGQSKPDIDIESFGWMADSDDEWNSENNFARQVTELCVTYPNVYCEIAYVIALIEGSGEERMNARRKFVKNLNRILAKGPGPSGDFRDKIAFGTDWHMPSMVRHPRQYLDVFLDIFSDEGRGDLHQFREEFFWRNAKRYLDPR